MKRRFFTYALCAGIGLSLAGRPATAVSAGAEEIKLSMTEAVQTALLKNLGLRLTQEDVNYAEGTAMAAEGTFDPQLSAEVGATGAKKMPVSVATAENEKTAAWKASVQKKFSTGTTVDLTWNNGNLDTDSNLYLFDPIYQTGTRLSVSQPLLKGLGPETQLADINSAQSDLEARSFLVDSQAADLAAQVKSAYWELVYAHQNLDVLTLSLKLAEKLRDDTATKITAGKLASLDLYQPESEVAQREQDLIVGERAIGVAEDNLKLLMDSRDWMSPFTPIDLPDVTPLEPAIDEVLDKALANRPDLKAAALQIDAAEYQVIKTRNNTLPSLDLNGAVGFGGTADTYGDAIDNSFEDADSQWQVGLVFSRPLDNSLAEGQYRQAIAQHNRSKTGLELLKQEIRRAVRVTVRDVELALKAIEATKKTAIATQKRLEAEQVKFDAGRSTTLDVLIAQQDYARALSTENRAKVAYAQTIAELDRIQGVITIAE